MASLRAVVPSGSTLKKIILPLAGAGLASLASIVGVGIYRLRTATTGDPSEFATKPSDRKRKALLIIDIQEDFTEGKGWNGDPEATASDRISTINSIAKEASAAGFEIIYIRNEFKSMPLKLVSKLFFGGKGISGRKTLDFDSDLLRVSNVEFEKEVCDAFSNPQLEKYLVENGVGEVYLCGLDGAACVAFTGLGALNRGYKVNLISDVVLTKLPRMAEEYRKKLEARGAVILSSEEFSTLVRE